MAGKVHELIKKLIDKRSKGNPVVANMVKTKLLLKGIQIETWTPLSPDDPSVIAKIRAIAADMGHAV
ncbi:hypothetical protein [Candidatus Symbiobacter mobilis]|uniref:Uncharacterized protein n=1 Tax=Candidatus Symbiobacter mobilis CR TaxID=946483 RepID=U5N898_9BURK|nr:hypothetical protein [Candidatus Symbiobacter mobilis]AGX87535.1 hypothetical protein Cenrod_1449 [Candidatus Symbiobacter mobilis CR]